MQNSNTSPDIAVEGWATHNSLIRMLKRHLMAGQTKDVAMSKLSLAESNALYAMRGVAITFVVIIHVTDWPIQIVFFCMPIFFFLSGYLFRPAVNFRSYLRSLAHKLLLPYLLFLVIVSIPVVTNLFLHEGSNAGFSKIWQLILGGEMIKGVFAAYWYPPCFVFMHILYSICSRWLNGAKVTLLCVPLLILAYWNSANDDFWLPFAINVVAMSFPIMHAGWLYRHRRFSLHADEILNNFVAIVGLSYTMLAVTFTAPGLQMKLANYGIPIITMFCAICMVIVTKLAFDYLARFLIVNLVIGNLGKASLIIMFVHMPLDALLVDVFDIHNDLAGVLFATAASYAVFRLLGSSTWGSRLFLGKG